MMTDLFLFALSNLMIFCVEKEDLESFNFESFFKIIFLLKDSKSRDFYPKKIIFLLQKFFDLEKFFSYSESFKQNMKKNWNDFLKKVITIIFLKNIQKN